MKRRAALRLALGAWFLVACGGGDASPDWTADDVLPDPGGAEIAPDIPDAAPALVPDTAPDQPEPSDLGPEDVTPPDTAKPCVPACPTCYACVNGACLPECPNACLSDGECGACERCQGNRCTPFFPCTCDEADDPEAWCLDQCGTLGLCVVCGCAEGACAARSVAGHDCCTDALAHCDDGNAATYDFCPEPGAPCQHVPNPTV